MTVLVTGSLAYDTLMTHEGKFQDSIIPGELDHLNVAFLIQHKEVEFGGCGGNIAYNLALLGEDVDLIGRAGRDFRDYEEWLLENGINTDHITIHEDTDTAVAYITTDSKLNQLTSFYPGAMGKETDGFFPNKSKDYSLAIIAPENTYWMEQAVGYCSLYSRVAARRFSRFYRYFFGADFNSCFFWKNN